MGKTLEFSAAEFEQMIAVQHEVNRAVLPFRENTEAALVIFALARTAKALLDLYNPLSRAETTEIVVAFLANDSRVIDPGPQSLIDSLKKFTH